ncbi:hypothetical protein RJ640_000642 [Escallonia rubra]|uniref:CCHC-type domain-containing protein n=1 Tax=Escallonia rubra TaxID=112253 RepID=A0AA88R2T2_9ASTE|nr:hypothetical protein RJ640_000642 [Escallonia rubra]
MKTIFKSLGLWESVVEGFTEPNTTEGMTENQKKKLDEKRQKDASALSLIQRNVTDPIFPRIMRVESAKEAWETLRNEFQGDDKVRAIKLQSLRKDLENMKMKEDESLKDYSSRFLELINQMKTHGEDISDRRIVEKTLISLPEKFDPIIAVIEETKDLSTLSVQEVMASLKSYEQRLARHTEKAVESAFQSKLNVGSKNQERKPQNFDQPKGESSRGGRYGRGRGRNRGRGRGNFGRSYNSENNSKPCGVCKKMSHVEKDCWFKGQPQCHRCKKFGHVKKDCRVKLHQQASFTEEKESEASLFYACQSATEKNDEMWFLDSGCSNHMAREKSIFLDMDSTVNTKMKLGNGSIVQAQGKGTIGIQTKQGTRFIRDVLLVPDLEHNLLSLGQLLENDYTLQFQDKCCIIYDKKGSKDVVTKIKMEKNRSFPINFSYTSGVAMRASIVEDSWLWHRRFGHINFKNLKLLHKENMVQGLPTIEEKHEVCEKDILIVALYVDDLLFTGNSEKMIKDFRKEMMKKYEMNDMGLLKHFLGMEVHQDDEGVFICQKNYAEKVLKKFRMYGCNSKATPLIVGEKLKREDGGSKVDATFYRSMVGNLLYLTATRPDIMFAASLISRFMQAPSHFHLGAANRVLRYIQGTIDYGIMNGRSKEVKLIGFCDSDFGGCKDDMKSTSGYCFTLGSGVFSWLSKKQQSVAQSSAEAEYVSAAIATSQAIWLRRIFHDFGQKQERKTELFCDNKSAIAMAKNPVFHSRTRHIALKYHFIREAIEDGEIELEFCRSKEQVADIFTKALPRERFEELRQALGVQQQDIKGENVRTNA